MPMIADINETNNINYKNYDSTLLNNTLHNLNYAETTLKQSKYDMIQFLKINKVTLEELFNKIEPLQNDRIENNIIIRYDPNKDNTIIKQYYNNYVNDCRNKNNKPISIKTRLQRINRILKAIGLKVPNMSSFNIEVTDQQAKKTVLTRSDINYIINNLCNIHQKAIYSFIASTGIRRHDVLNFTIKDFLQATYKYHKTLNLDTFLNTIDNNYMVGYWEFKPHKTQKRGLICKTCNSAESTNYIIESLKQRKISIEKANKKNNTNNKLSENMPLFSNKRQKYLSNISLQGLTSITNEKHHIFKDYKLKSIENDFKNDIINITEYNKLMDNIPIFNLHNLRHYYISVLSQYIPNTNLRLVMEAHTSKINTDKYYIGESSELYNEDTIREEYKKVEQYLTFNNLNIDSQLIKTNEKLLNDYEAIKKENVLLNNMIDEIKKEYEDTRSKLLLLNNFVDCFELEEGVTDLNQMKRTKII